jgi:hypothetical protein
MKGSVENMNARTRQKLIWKRYIKHHYFPIHELTDEVMSKLIDRESGMFSSEIIDLLDADTLEEFLELDIEELKKWGYEP